MKLNSGSKFSSNRSTKSSRSTAAARPGRATTRASRGSTPSNLTRGRRRMRPGTQAARSRHMVSSSSRRVGRSTASVLPRSIQSLRDKLQPMILPGDLPGWLQSLMQIQRVVWVGTVAFSTGALGAYGWAVYSQQQWSHSYSQLQQLQRQERQLISSNELMKNQIAQKVDPKALGLAPPKANNVIFLQPEQSSAKPAAVATPPLETETPPSQPLGY